MKKKTLDEAYEAAKEEYKTYPESELFHYTDTKVTYNKNGIISISINASHYTGSGSGRPSYDNYGMTFDLKTGKKLYLSDVCKGTSKQIKQEIKKSVTKDAKKNWGVDKSQLRLESVDERRLNDYEFYLIPKSKAVVCFNPYEIMASDLEERTCEIKSKYK